MGCAFCEKNLRNECVCLWDTDDSRWEVFKVRYNHETIEMGFSVTEEAKEDVSRYGRIRKDSSEEEES